MLLGGSSCYLFVHCYLFVYLLSVRPLCVYCLMQYLFLLIVEEFE